MVSPARVASGEPPQTVFEGSQRAVYAMALIAVFLPLFMLGRSTILIGDGEDMVRLARTGGPADLYYAEPSRFLQVPLTRAVWRGLDALGLPVSAEFAYLSFCLAGALTAIVFMGFIAAELLRTRTAAWVTAFLFGTSLHVWTHWNGELYALAFGFMTAAVFLALRGRLVAPACLWALAVSSRSDFMLAAPVVAMAVWTAHDGARAPGKLRRTALVLALAAATTLAILLVGSRLAAKWDDLASLQEWFSGSYERRLGDVTDRPEVVRAAKGLVTAYTVAGHYWRDILTGRGLPGDPAFIAASGAGLVVLALTALFVVRAWWSRRAAVLGVAWVLPAHVLLNWWFLPTVEKYHGVALPGFVLLVAAGLIAAAARMPSALSRALFVGYVALCAALNLFGAVLPMRGLGIETTRAEAAIRRLHVDHGGRSVFVSCDDPLAIRRAGVPFLRVKAIWTGNADESRRVILSWAQARIREGKEPYLFGRWCLPEEWIGPGSKAPFDLFFLADQFELVPTGIVTVPVAHTPMTNPFGWRREDVVRLKSRSGAS